jgi:hypothetical protein
LWRTCASAYRPSHPGARTPDRQFSPPRLKGFLHSVLHDAAGDVVRRIHQSRNRFLDFHSLQCLYYPLGEWVGVAPVPGRKMDADHLGFAVLCQVAWQSADQVAAVLKPVQMLPFPLQGQVVDPVVFPSL